MDPRSEAIVICRERILHELESVGMTGHEGDPLEAFEAMAYIPEVYRDDFVKLEVELIGGKVSMTTYDVMSNALLRGLRRELTNGRVFRILRSASR